MFHVRLTVLAALLLYTPAFAADSKADHYNLSSAMSRKAERNLWTGVESDFRQMLKERMEPTLDEWLLGAKAARTIGDAATARERLIAAQAIGASDELADTIASYDAEWTPVKLLAKPNAPGLAPDVRPFQPDKAKAIEFAADRIGVSGAFTGLLPAGKYTLSTKAFELVPGADQITVNHKGAAVDQDIAAKLSNIPVAPPSVNTGSIPLYIGAGAAIVLSGVAFGVSSGANQKYYSDDIDVTELDAARNTANTFAIVSGVSLGVGIGLGATGVIMGIK